jgi:5-methylcytosine-specific restriction enzyme A
MVASPKTICTQPGCNRLIPTGIGGRCEQHKREREQTGTKNRSGDPFYSSKAWKVRRDARRHANPLCQECEANGVLTPMHAVDHVLPRSTHPELELDYENTQSLCERCHNRKTGRETMGKMQGQKELR